MQFTSALNAWEPPAFEATLKHEIEQLDVELLPLQQGLSQSSYTSGANRSVLIMGITAGAEFIRVKTGIFYSGIIPGCSCADDPTPMSEITEYCEVQFEINKMTAETTVTLLTD